MGDKRGAPVIVGERRGRRWGYDDTADDDDEGY